MAEIINLRSARKSKQRRDKEQQSEANRQLHGQSGLAKKQIQLEKSKAKAALDGHLIKPTETFNE